MKTPKRIKTVFPALALLLASLASLKAESEFTLDWNSFDMKSEATVKDSLGRDLAKSAVTFLLGTFTSTNWSQINRANLTNSFVQYNSATTHIGRETTFTINNPPTNSVTAYLVLLSGQSDLGIYYWADQYGLGSLVEIPIAMPGNGSFFTPSELLADGADNIPAILSAVGTVQATGVMLASASGSQLSSQFITFNAIPSKTLGESFSLTAFASSNLPITYISSNTNVATVSGSTVTIVGAGPVTITASQPGNGVSYAAASSVPQTFTTYAKTALTLSSVGVPSYNGTSTIVTHNFVGNPSSKYTLEYTTDLNAGSWPSVSVQTDSAGNCAVPLSTLGDYVSAWKSRMFFRAKNS